MRASSTTCCLNLSPPPSPSSLPTKTTQVATTWQKPKERSWTKRSVLGVACVIIALQTENIKTGEIVLAEEFQENVVVLKNDKVGVMRWSDRRSCMPWRWNSLETIVPENLPRPLSHRRWESVGLAGATAPALNDTVNKSGSNEMYIFYLDRLSSKQKDKPNEVIVISSDSDLDELFGQRRKITPSSSDTDDSLFNLETWEEAENKADVHEEEADVHTQEDAGVQAEVVADPVRVPKPAPRQTLPRLAKLGTGKG